MFSALGLIFVLVILILVAFIGEFGIWILLGAGLYAIVKMIMEYLTNKNKPTNGQVIKKGYLKCPFFFRGKNNAYNGQKTVIKFERGFEMETIKNNFAEIKEQVKELREQGLQYLYLTRLMKRASREINKAGNRKFYEKFQKRTIKTQEIEKMESIKNV